MQMSLCDEMRSYRCRQEREQRDQQLMHRHDAMLEQRAQHRCDEDPSDSQRGCLGGSMKPRHGVLQLDQAIRSDEAEYSADNEKHCGQNVMLGFHLRVTRSRFHAAERVRYAPRGAAPLLLDRVRVTAGEGAAATGVALRLEEDAAGGGGCMASGREAGAGG